MGIGPLVICTTTYNLLLDAGSLVVHITNSGPTVLLYIQLCIILIPLTTPDAQVVLLFMVCFSYADIRQVDTTFVPEPDRCIKHIIYFRDS